MKKISMPLFEIESEQSFSSVAERLRFCKKVEYKELSLNHISKILYAIQGVTSSKYWSRLKAIPSAGATYPLQVYINLSTKEVESGLYRYESKSEKQGELIFQKSENERKTQIFIHAIFSRTTSHYGSRGISYVLMEVGHALQNALLEASVLGIDMTYRLEIEEIDREMMKGEKPLAVIELGACLEKPIFAYRKQAYENSAIGLAVSKPDEISLEEAIIKRRSIREYSPKNILLKELTYILYYSCGKVWNGFRPYAPPLDTYHLNVFLVIGGVNELDPGIYFYNDQKNELILLKHGDYRRALYNAALRQSWILKAPLSVVLTGKDVDKRYLDVETGMIGQSIYLTATSINLGTVSIGAFYDEEVAEVIGVNEQPLYIMPIGKL